MIDFKSVYALALLFFILTTLMLYFSNTLLLNENLYFTTFSEQLTFEQINNILLENKKWEWVGYLLVPILTLLKILIIASYLSLGAFFATNKLSYKSLFKIALQAEFIFIVPVIIKLLWFSFVQTDYSFVDIQLFSPFSALGIFDVAVIQKNQAWLIYPLQTLSVFEVAYWFLLAKGVSEILKKDFTKSFELVMASYGTGLILWIVTVMFITVTYGI